MASKDESKQQALIIALVCFVVLSLGLGVATYYGFAGQEELKKQAAEAKKEKDVQLRRGDWEQFQALALKAHLGHNLTKEDQESLAALGKNYDAGKGNLGKDEKNYADGKSLLDRLSHDMGWDQKKQQPVDTYFQKKESLENDNVLLRSSLAKAQEDFTKAREKLDAELKSTQAEKEEMAKALANSKAELAKTIADKSAAFLALQKTVEQRDDQINELTKEVNRLQDEKAGLAKKADKRERNLITQNEKLKEQLAPPSVDDYNQPKARIWKLDRTGTTAYIDIGSADNLKPPQTFSIMGVGPNGRANQVRKGAVEVTRVLGPHLSEARITDVTDPGRNPITEGDQLFNPSWSPNLRMHVALTGLIDLTGTGKDDTAEFVRSLERQGVVVDAYLDLKDMTVKGNGINRQTDYLVEGDQPSLEGTQMIREGDPGLERKQAVFKKVAEMKTEAANEGVAIIKLRRYLSMIGYRLPRVIPGASGTSSLPYIGSLPESSKQEAPAKDAGKEKTDKPTKEKEK
jgi:hypothetical protein